MPKVPESCGDGRTIGLGTSREIPQADTRKQQSNGDKWRLDPLGCDQYNISRSIGFDGDARRNAGHDLQRHGSQDRANRPRCRMKVTPLPTWTGTHPIGHAFGRRKVTHVVSVLVPPVPGRSRRRTADPKNHHDATAPPGPPGGPDCSRESSQGGPVSTEEEIERLDGAEFQAVEAGDLVTLDDLWADDLVVTPPSHTPNRKPTVLARVERGLIAYREATRIVEQVIVHDLVAVSVGREIVVPKGDRPEAGQRLLRRYTHVWVQDGGSWRLLARHASAVGPVDDG